MSPAPLRAQEATSRFDLLRLATATSGTPVPSRLQRSLNAVRVSVTPMRGNLKRLRSPNTSEIVETIG